MPVKGSTRSLDIHLKQVEKTLGRKPKELEERLECPLPFKYLWEYYLELKSDVALTYTEIKNWQELSLTEISHWEVRIIKTLDRIYWNIVYDRHRKTIDSSE